MIQLILFILASTGFASDDWDECARQLTILQDKIETSENSALVEALASEATRLTKEISTLAPRARSLPLKHATDKPSQEELVEVSADSEALTETLTAAIEALAWLDEHIKNGRSPLLAYFHERNFNKQATPASIFEGLIFISQNPHLFNGRTLDLQINPDDPEALSVPLYNAIRHRYFKEANRLLDLGARAAGVLTEDDDGIILFHRIFAVAVAQHAPLELLQRLLDKGADPNQAQSDSSPNTLFHITAQTPLEVIEFLIDAGTRTDVVDFHKKSIIMRNMLTPEQMHYLIKKGAPLEARNDDGKTALVHFAESYFKYGAVKDLEIAETLIDAGADLNAANVEGRSARLLIEAAQHAHNKTHEPTRELYERVLSKIRARGDSNAPSKLSVLTLGVAEKIRNIPWFQD